MASSYSNYHPVDEILTSLVSEAVPSDSQLIASQVFETVKIPQRSGTLLVENTRNFMGSPDLDTRRAPGASRALIGSFDRTSLIYKAETHGLGDKIAMEEIADSQYPGSEEARSARKVRRSLMLSKEKRAADLLFNAAVFTNTNNCTAVMGGKVNAAGTDALTGLDKVKDLVFQASHGINPDSIVLGRGVARSLARNAEFRSYLTVGTIGANFGVAGGGSLVLNDEAVKSIIRDVLGIPNVYIGSARRETANPGATSAESQIWTDDSLFCGILKGSDAIVSKTAGVKAMPVAALNFELMSLKAGQYDSVESGICRNVWAEEMHLFKAIDPTLGFLVTTCL